MARNKVKFEKSEVAIRHGLRISSPNGYYPEDVDRVLVEFEDRVSHLTRENEKLIRNLEQARDDLSKLQAEFGQYRLNATRGLTLQETSFEEDIRNTAKLYDINKKDSEPTVEILQNDADADLDIVGVLDTKEDESSSSAVMDTGELDILEL